MHFNDIQLRIRNFSILLLSAFVGGIGVTMKEHYQVQAFDHSMSLTAVIFFAGAIMWSAFYFMDRYWYHPLLLGAVAHGLNVEDLLAARLNAAGLSGVNQKGEALEAAALTKTIGKKSPVKIFGVTLRSSNKEHVFYGGIFAVLVGMGVVVLFSTTNTPAIDATETVAKALVHTLPLQVSHTSPIVAARDPAPSQETLEAQRTKAGAKPAAAINSASAP